MKEKKGLEDLQLIMAIRSGDELAFNQLYEKYNRLVYFIAFEMCHNDADAKDILQNTFIQVHKHIVDLQEPENFRAWLNRITINLCKNYFRSRKTVELDEENAWFKNHLVEERSYMIPQKHYRYDSDCEVIYELIRALPNAQSEVLILRFVQGMSMKEIADVINVPVGTVKTRLLYGKANLKKLIQQYEQENSIKLDFKFTPTFLAAFGFAYGIEKTLQPVSMNWMKKKMLSTINPSHVLLPLLACSVAVVTGGVLLTQNNSDNQKEIPQIQPAPVAKSIDTEDSHGKAYYFKLMDWACCRDDMELKSKADFDSVSFMVDELRTRKSKYYEQLQSNHWIENFDELYAML